MRLRNIPESADVLAASPYCIDEPEKARGHWREIFGNDGPLMAEFGCGKGKFPTTLASALPHVNYIGIDKYSSVLYKGIKRLEGKPFIENLRFCCLYASTLNDIFAPGELDRVFLNFSDPWPKYRHAHRRLTARGFLEIYENILKPGGCIEFKTDNDGLFDFSIEELDKCGWEILAMTDDLHKLFAEADAGRTPERSELGDIVRELQNISVERENARDTIRKRKTETSGMKAAEAAEVSPDVDDVVPLVTRAERVLLSGTADNACELLAETRFMTEYEERFVSQGKNIHKVIARKKPCC